MNALGDDAGTPIYHETWADLYREEQRRDKHPANGVAVLALILLALAVVIAVLLAVR